MAELAEGLDAVVLAEGRAARLEERLRREHQDAHESLYLTEPVVVRLQCRSQSPDKDSSLLKNLVRLSVSAACLYFVLRSIDLPAFWARVQSMNPMWIVLAFAAYALTQSISVWRWRRLLRAQHIEVERRRLTESIWVSMFFNNFLPSNIGGDVVRIADTAPAAGSKTLATTVILVDRALGLTALLLVAAVGAFAAWLGGTYVPGARWVWLASAVGVGVAILVIAVPDFVGHLLDRKSVV